MRASPTRLAAVLAPALLVTACGGASPKPSPVVDSSASASASPSGAPTLPAEAQGTDNNSKVETVRFYLRVLSYAARTGDVNALDQVSTQDCESCANVRDSIVKVYDSGGRLTGDGYEASAAVVEPKQVEGDPVLRVQIISHPQSTFTGSSVSPSIAPEEVIAARFRLSRQADHWVVREWTRVS